MKLVMITHENRVTKRYPVLDELDEEDKKWHLIYDSEHTFCGFVFVDGNTSIFKTEPKGGITCPRCLDMIKTAKKIRL